MSDQRIVELLTRKMANEATEEELQELGQLLSSYPSDLSTVEKMQDIWQAPVDDENISRFFERHMERYGQEIHPAPVEDDDEDDFRRTRRNRSLIVALGILALIGTTLALYLTRSNREAPPAIQIVVAKGMRRIVTLPDGTKVWLNGDSRLRYDSYMNENERRYVTLNGEAYFDVAPDANRPFYINTNKLSIKVIGTAFNVRDYPGDITSETTLIRGSVELTVNDKSKQKIIMKPSEKVAVIDSSGNRDGQPINSTTVIMEHINPIKIANKEYIPEISWTENKLLFEDETLKEIAKKLERWYNKQVTVSDPAIADYRFTCACNDKTIDQVLTALQEIRYFNLKKSSDEITIY